MRKHTSIQVLVALFVVSWLPVVRGADEKKPGPGHGAEAKSLSCTAVVPAAGQVGVPVQFMASTSSVTGGGVAYTDPIVGNLRFVPAGSFMQGSPETEPCREPTPSDQEPQFLHVLTRNLMVMESEVSRKMWADLQNLVGGLRLPADPSDLGFSPTQDHPVNGASWQQAVIFANELSKDQGLTPCYYTDATETEAISMVNIGGSIYCDFDANGYRLPTEGEWEYFCRAETTGPFWVNESQYNINTCSTCSTILPALSAVAAYCRKDVGTAPVKSLLPNPWNLWDVHGNVWEWCWDREAPYPDGLQVDYRGPDVGAYREYRGGSFYDEADYVRSAQRGGYWPNTSIKVVGFRLVRTAP